MIMKMCSVVVLFPSVEATLSQHFFLWTYRTGNELHEPKFSEDDMEFIVEEKNIKKEVKEGL
jgi:hypothetical protein